MLYVNDLENASASFKRYHICWIDTKLFVSHKDINTLFQIVNAELKNLETWFINGNKLSLNLTKTSDRYNKKGINSKIPTIMTKINGQTAKFAKITFPRYTESVKFRSQSRETTSKRKPYRGLGTR